jgi:hypothetical protein
MQRAARVPETDPRASRRSILYVAAGLIIIAISAWSSSLGRSPVLSARGGEASALPQVYLVFSPQDCGSSIEALAAWNAIHERGSMKVEGLLYGTVGPSTTLKIARGAGLRFPIDPSASALVDDLRLRTGYRSGSFVAISDPEGRVRLTFGLDDPQIRRMTDLATVFFSTSENHGFPSDF